MKRTAAVCCIILLAALYTGCESPTNIAVEIDAPLQVTQGEQFLITMTVTNTAPETQRLMDIDIGEKYTEGIAFISIDPAPLEMFHTPLVNMMTYSFNRDIGPGRQAVITFHSKALKPGDYNTNIDFCINSSSAFLTKTIRTLVEQP